MKVILAGESLPWDFTLNRSLHDGSAPGLGAAAGFGAGGGGVCVGAGGASAASSLSIGAGEIGIEATGIVRQKRLEARSRAQFLGAVEGLFLGARARLRSLGLCTLAVAEHGLLVCAASLHELLEAVAALREIERGGPIAGHGIVERLLLGKRGPELIVVLDVEIDAAEAFFSLRALNVARKRLLETATREAQGRVRAIGKVADIGPEGEVGELRARAGARIAFARHLHIIRLRHAIDETRGHRAFVVGVAALEELPLHVADLGCGRLGLTGQDEGEQRGCEEEGSRHWRCLTLGWGGK